MPFPEIPACAGESEVEGMAVLYLDRILEYNCNAFMVQREFAFTYHLIKLLEQNQITALAAYSERSTEELCCARQDSKEQRTQNKDALLSGGQTHSQSQEPQPDQSTTPKC